MLIYNVSYGEEEQGGGKYKSPTTFLSAFENVRKYLIRFDDNTKAALRKGVQGSAGTDKVDLGIHSSEISCCIISMGISTPKVETTMLS
jgi:hypothetical protein